ncbi:MAG: helix-turn-helix domain-containing protein [Dethiobacter sp.]|nr:helix-turn-helix domain-containing protein [Dethiobacter sp.]MBS3902698.1 helix-turn-helix domain-containing protein [Dethiobacter sp.]MBS3989729.1 helix-turn-helix domain-containing protein [Dethiobacter sp.]
MKFAKSSEQERAVYTVPEIASKLGVNLTRAYELARSADFPALQLSKKRIVIPKRAFDTWLNEQALQK